MSKFNNPAIVLFAIFLCGQDSLILHRRIKAKVKHISKIVNLAVMGALIGFVLSDIDQVNYVKVMVYSVLISSIIPLIEGVMNIKLSKHISDSVQSAVEYMQNTMNITLQMNIFFKNYNMKIGLCFIFILISFVVRLTLSTTLFTFSNNAVACVAVLYKFAAISNAIFHIDLMRFFLTSISEKLESHSRSSISEYMTVQKTINEIQTVLRRVKVIHFKLWIISKKINKYFQWSLIIILLESAMTCIHSAITVVVYTHDVPTSELYASLRKYIKFVSISSIMIRVRAISNFVL